MKLNLALIISISLLFIAGYINQAYSQTEGFNVKTPTQKIADSSTSFLNQIIGDSKKDTKNAIPKSLVCGSSCFLVIPDIEIIPSRGDFTGTGLLSCRNPNSDGFTEPIYYKINNLQSFNEGGGGLIIFGTSTQAMKDILGNNLHLTSDNSSTGQVGSTKDADHKSIVSYAKYKDEDLQGIDLSGSIIEYSSLDTFDAYQGTVVPIEIIYAPQDVPPVLRGFASALAEWTKNCK